MSILTGILRFDGMPVQNRFLEHIVQSQKNEYIHHQKVWSSGSIGFTHSLLCATPEDCFECQPLSSTNLQLHLVADLRLDNRSELELALDIPPNSRNSHPDSVYMLHAIEKWGLQAFTHLKGGYAGAVWDTTKQLLHLFRDPMGERPLFYYMDNKQFVFASSFRGLFAHPEILQDVNPTKIADYLLFNSRDRGSTVYKNIHRVPPGKVETIDLEKNLKSWGFHNYSPKYQIRLPSDAEYAEAMREKLEISVARQIRSIRGIGSHLSSGLDSGTIACIAANQLKPQGRRLSAFTWVASDEFKTHSIPGRYCDESPLARLIASQNGNIDLSIARSCETYYSPDILDDTIFYEAPNFYSSVSWHETIMKQASEMDLGVMLTAFNGNFTFSCDLLPTLPDLLRSLKVNQALKLASSYASMEQTSSMRIMMSFGLKPYLKNVIKRMLSKWAFMSWSDFCLIRPEYAQSSGSLDRAEQAGSLAFLNGDFQDPTWFRTEATIGADYKADFWFHLENQYGVVMREPTADLDLFSFCLALPDEQFIKRAIAKRATANLLPDKILNNKQRGYQNGDWQYRFERSIPNMKIELGLLASSPIANEVIDLDRLHQLLEGWPTVDWHSPKTFANYFFAVTRGLQIGKFIRGIERRCLV